MHASHASSRLAFFLVLFAFGSSACQFGPDPTWGEKHVAQFVWNESVLTCLFACDADAPMATRSISNLDVYNSSDLPNFTIQNDAPDTIAASQTSPSEIRCQALQAGQTTIHLIATGTGTEIDRFVVEAHDVAHIELQIHDLFDQELLIVEGGGTSVGIDLLDDHHRELVGIGAVDYSVDADLAGHVALSSAASQFLTTLFFGIHHEFVDIEALSIGRGTVRVQAPSGAALEIPTAVIDASEITRVVVDPPASKTISVGTMESVAARAFVGTERAYAAPCVWNVTPTSVALVSSMDLDVIEITGAAPGSATVSCTVGSSTGSRVITVR